MQTQELQNFIVKKRNEYGFGQQEITAVLCGLVSEVGELASSIRHQYILGYPPIPEDDKSSLKHEIADVMFYLCAIANLCNVDVEQATLSKIKINDTRFIK